MMRPLAHGGAAVLAGPGDARLAHTADESVSGEELSAGIALFRDLGLHFLGRSL
jgi:acetylornithine deacetylase/succinyl-diaminopimelate desuccinylase-like protein